MNTRTEVEAFVAETRLVLVGATRNRRKFGNLAFRELRNRGYRLFPVNRNSAEIDGETCYPSLAALPERVEAALIVVAPDQTEEVVREAAAAGVRRVWMQQGAESPEAVRFCNEHGMSVVAGECILMYAQPKGIHKFHRWLWGVLGKLPR